VNYEPKFLIEWPSRWEEFKTAIGPALARSPRQLAGEASTRLIPYKNLAITWGVEALLVLIAILLPAQLATLHPNTTKKSANYDVIYFSGDELPQTEDAGGAPAGKTGRAGGHEAFHRTQTIRVARNPTVREQVVDAPDVKLPRSNTSVANLLAYHSVPGPPPSEGLRNIRAVPAFNQMAAVAPAPELQQQRSLRAPTLPMNVVAPAPTVQIQQNSSFHLPGSNPLQVVPPPVSAPTQLSSNARLTLPATRVVAPPPTLTKDFATKGPGFGPTMQQQVVPPRVQAGNLSSTRQPITGLTGSTSVVPPQAQAGLASSSRNDVSLGSNVKVVPPSPTLSAAATPRGLGRQGIGLGSPMDQGSFTAPPAAPASHSGAGVVVSSKPGSTVGVPGNGSPGALAMSPIGQEKPGIGKGSTGETGISRGDASASGLSGQGSGGAKAGSGQSTELTARNGNSPYPGTGGAGSGRSSVTPVPGVAVEGGGSIVTLPSFGSDGSQPDLPGHSSTRPSNDGPGITIVATSRSGGAFNFYGALKGDKVYTIYIDTKLGTAVMQFADPTSVMHPYSQDLIAPQPMRADLPAGLPHSRLVIACVLDRTGMVKNPHVLETGTAAMTSKVLAALNNWKFRPVFRGDQPIEVNAILGFNIDTSDRY
jgi:hypothetical protein